MKATYNLTARKRSVNLTLNEDLVAQARSVTTNLSEVIESEYRPSLLERGFISDQRAGATERSFRLRRCHSRSPECSPTNPVCMCTAPSPCTSSRTVR